MSTSDEDREAQRREELAASGPYNRGVAQAKQQALDNARLALQSGLLDLKRTTLLRDQSVAGRDSYSRCHAEVVRRAERLSQCSGEGVAVPAWIPPPTAADQATVIVKAPTPAAEPAVKRKDPGAKLTGLPVFGSRLDSQLRDAGVLK
jgi:hypothetical protein